jgi:hypothetical protein
MTLKLSYVACTFVPGATQDAADFPNGNLDFLTRLNLARSVEESETMCQ